MQLFEMQGLLAGKCLPGDMKVNESLAEYLLRKLEDRNELERQLSAKTISEQNIINAFCISGEGAHSKLVIEYVSGLVAENAALKDINAWCRTEAFQNMYREFKIAEAAGCDSVDCMHDAMLTAIMHAPSTPNTDTFTAELRAQGVDECARTFNSETIEGSSMVMAAKTFAANLRAGRKG